MAYLVVGAKKKKKNPLRERNKRIFLTNGSVFVGQKIVAEILLILLAILRI